MASQAKHSAIARYIEPTRRSRNYVMHFEAGLTPASLTAPASTSQHERPQPTVTPRGP